RSVAVHQGLENGFLMMGRKTLEQLLIGPFLGDISDHFADMPEHQVQLAVRHWRLSRIQRQHRDRSIVPTERGTNPYDRRFLGELPEKGYWREVRRRCPNGDQGQLVATFARIW